MIRFNVIRMRSVAKTLLVTSFIILVTYIFISITIYVINYFNETPLDGNSFVVVKDYKMLQYIIDNNAPIIKVSNNENSLNIKNDLFINKLQNFIFGVDFSDLKTIIASELPMVTLYSSGFVPALAEVKEQGLSQNKELEIEESLDQKEDNSENIKSINEILKDDENEEASVDENIKEVTISSSSKNGYLCNEGVYIKNETTKKINIINLIKEKVNIKLSKNEPTVLIIHTHTSEAYTPSKQNFYIPSDPDRTEDNRYNIVRIGNELAKFLEADGIQVLHDTTCHDYPSYNGSYRKSLNTITERIKEYPSIRFVLDIHRDAFALEDGKKLKVTTSIDGKKIAQIMQVVGTNELGLKHDNWEENFKFALHLQKNIIDEYKDFARPINLRKERFNQHATCGSVLIEIGSNGNTLEEALESCEYLSKVLAKTINQIKEGVI